MKIILPKKSLSAASTPFENFADRLTVCSPTPRSDATFWAVLSNFFKGPFWPFEKFSDLLSPPDVIFCASYCRPIRYVFCASVGQIDTLGGNQETTIINESGPCNKERMLRFGTSFLWGSGKTGGTLFTFRVKNFMKCYPCFIRSLLRFTSDCDTLSLTSISSAIAWGNCTPLERSWWMCSLRGRVPSTGLDVSEEAVGAGPTKLASAGVRSIFII